MYLTLFNVAGWAIVAWLLLVLLPTWKVTRRLAESAAFQRPARSVVENSYADHLRMFDSGVEVARSSTP